MVLPLIVIINEVTKVVNADQPVHCIRGQVYGSWDFYVS